MSKTLPESNGLTPRSVSETRSLRSSNSERPWPISIGLIMMRSSSRTPASARLAVRWVLPMMRSSPPVAALIARACSTASPRATVVADQETLSREVEKTTLGLVFIREVMAGSFTWACSVGQYGGHVLVSRPPEAEGVRLVELVDGEVVELLVDDGPVELSARTFVEAVDSGDDERCQGSHGLFLSLVHLADLALAPLGRSRRALFDIGGERRSTPTSTGPAWPRHQHGPVTSLARHRHGPVTGGRQAARLEGGADGNMEMWPRAIV